MKLTHLVALLLAGAALTLPAAAATDVAPGDDFSRFANGDWERATAIPDGYNAWGARAQLRQDNLEKMAALYQEAARGGPGISAAAQRVGLYNAAQMDLATIERKGLAPVRAMLDEIGALRDKTALARYLGARLRVDVDPVNFGAFASENPFGLWVGPGLKNPARHLPYLLQGGLSLGGPEAYLASDADQQAVIAQLRRYIGELLGAAGVTDAETRAGRIADLETRIARTHASTAASSDLAKAAPLWRRADFKTRAPGLDWDAYFNAAGLPARQQIGAWQPDAIKGIAALVAAAPLQDWKDYLQYHALNMNARFLPKAFSDRYFAFYDPIFIGPSLHRPFWDHVVTQTNTDMPGAGQLFAERHFSPKAKAGAAAMVREIVAAFDARIDTLVWLSPAARKQARAKLNAMVIGIGHPDAWRSSEGLEVRADDAFGNVQRVQAFNYRHELAKIGRPVDRKEWILGAELFGINQMPLQNALTIPMTDLQPPLFDADGPDAANYGAVGTRIARFIGIGLDAAGSRFDAKGRPRAWWSKADQAHFRQAMAPLARQYSAYKAFPDLALNGERTLNSNHADLTGLTLAYAAYRNARARNGAADDKAADQRFFIAYAESLRFRSTDQVLRGQAAGSPQPPAPWRVATVRNLDAWHSAFDVRPEQQLYLAPAARIKVW